MDNRTIPHDFFAFRNAESGATIYIAKCNICFAMSIETTHDFELVRIEFPNYSVRNSHNTIVIIRNINHISNIYSVKIIVCWIFFRRVTTN